MIEKIQNFIEDNSSFSVTRSQVILGLILATLLFVFIVFLMVTMSGKPVANDINTSISIEDAPVYTGQ